MATYRALAAPELGGMLLRDADRIVRLQREIALVAGRQPCRRQAADLARLLTAHARAVAIAHWRRHERPPARRAAIARGASMRRVTIIRPAPSPRPPRGSEWAEARVIVVRERPRLTVTLTLGPSGMTAEWFPSMPRRLAERHVRRYQRRRDAFIADVAPRLGPGSVIVID